MRRAALSGGDGAGAPRLRGQRGTQRRWRDSTAGLIGHANELAGAAPDQLIRSIIDVVVGAVVG